MKSQIDYARAFNKWKRDFTAASAADNHLEFQRTIEHLKLECSPKKMMRDTIILVSTAMLYIQLDGTKCESFLSQQRYHLTSEGENEYILTFDLGDGRYGRLLGDLNLTFIDLADLFGHCDAELEIAGFECVYITRLDGRTIGKGELKLIDQSVRNDIYFDYGEDEIHVSVSRLRIKDTVEVSATEDFF